MGLRIGKGKISRYDVRREDRNSLWFYIENGGNFKNMSGLSSLDPYLIASDFKLAPSSMAYMFYNCSNLTSIPVIDAPKTSEFSNTFKGCSKLASIEINAPLGRSFDSTFEDCPNLESVIISGAKIDWAQETFMNDYKLKFVSDLDMSLVEVASGMFWNCYQLKAVNFVNMSSLVKYGSNMFTDCHSLTSIQGLVTDNMIDMSNMFNGCHNLDFTDIALNTSKVTNMDGAFTNCYLLKTLSIDTSQVTSMRQTFYGCSKLDFSAMTLDTSKVQYMKKAFAYCSFTEAPLIDTSSVVDMEEMFYCCNKLKTVSKLDTSKATYARWLFYGCSSLISLPESMPFSKYLRSTYSMFNQCGKLVSVPEDINTSAVTDMRYMFYRCSSLKAVPALDASKVTTKGYLDSMFSGCDSLEEIHMTGMKVSFYIYASTKFTREALVEIIGNLAEVTSTQTLTMGSTNLAKLTDDDKAVATGKGWTLK